MIDAPPISSEHLFKLAVAAHEAGRADEAIRLYRAVLAVGPKPVASGYLGALLDSRGRFEEALAVHQAALAANPRVHRTAFDLSLSLLRLGRYREAWQLHEARLPIGEQKPVLSFPEWTGQPIRSLMVIREQGLGDQIMFARYVLALQRSGVDVTLTCAPVLERLFASAGLQVLPAEGDTIIPRRDGWVMLGSLPYRFNSSIETIPPAPYLPSKSGGRGIGFVGRGNPGHSNDASRSLPDALVADIASWPGVVSLTPEATGARDFEDTARIIDDLELVLTVDTSVAHLAGAMGKPVWIMLPFVPDWRWSINRTDSPWYPSARLFRQRRPGDWRSVAAAVADALAARSEYQVSPKPRTGMTR